ncbi:hypothetical protein LCGC14_1065140 [marine sediment metagenome]|uniref:Uncharacterized protein n=1 Tax=marine sediment metagenome TaxID=412755 RepID=A0A0F9N6V4_9ZZZZ
MPVPNYSIDLSLITGKLKPKITNTCIDWCREAHFAHNTNLEIEMLFLPAGALLLLIAYQILRNNEKLKPHVFKFLIASKWLLIAFFGLFFYRYFF